MLTDYSKSTHSTESGRISYKFSFQVDNDADLRVMVVDPADLEQVALYLGLDYLVAGVGNADGGSIELTAAGQKKAAAGLKIMIKQGQAHQYQMPIPSGETGGNLSEDEVAVGIDYTDGNRVIYQKTIAMGALPLGSSTQYKANNTFHNIAGLRNCWSEKCWALASGGGDFAYLPLPYASPLTYGSITLGIDHEKVSITSWRKDLAKYTQSWCTIRYTKE